MQNRQVGIEEMNASEPLKKCRKSLERDQKWGSIRPMTSLKETCLPIRRSSALRWHQLYLGLCGELGNHHPDVKGEIQARPTCCDSILYLDPVFLL